jgi:hypothetical protein
MLAFAMMAVIRHHGNPSQPKKRNTEPRQKQNPRRRVIDPMVNPGNSARRHQACSKADPTRPHHRMVTLAQNSPSDCSVLAPQSKTTTVMLGRARASRRKLATILKILSKRSPGERCARKLARSAGESPAQVRR